MTRYEKQFNPCICLTCVLHNNTKQYSCICNGCYARHITKRGTEDELKPCFHFHKPKGLCYAVLKCKKYERRQ